MSWSDLPEWQREYVSVLFRGDDAAARRFESSGFLKDNFGSDGNVVSFIALQRANRQLDPNSESALEDAGVPTAVAAGRDPYFGGVSAISARGAGSDPRRSGHVWLQA